MPSFKREHQAKLDLKKRRIRVFFLSIEKKKKKKEVVDESGAGLY